MSRINYTPQFLHFNNQQSTIITRQSSIRPSRCCAVRLRMVNGPRHVGLASSLSGLAHKKDGNHEHHRTEVMKTVTGWKPIPREQTMCSTLGWVKRSCRGKHHGA